MKKSRSGKGSGKPQPQPPSGGKKRPASPSQMLGLNLLGVEATPLNNLNCPVDSFLLNVGRARYTVVEGMVHTAYLMTERFEEERGWRYYLPTTVVGDMGRVNVEARLANCQYNYNSYCAAVDADWQLLSTELYLPPPEPPDELHRITYWHSVFQLRTGESCRLVRFCPEEKLLQVYEITLSYLPEYEAARLKVVELSEKPSPQQLEQLIIAVMTKSAAM